MQTSYFLPVIAALGADKILEAGGQVGSASNQYLLGALIVALIGIVLYREKQQNVQNKLQIATSREAAQKAEEAIRMGQSKHDSAVCAAQLKHDVAVAEAVKERRDLYVRMEAQDAAMSEERRQRWTMIIDVIRENTTAFRGVRETLDNLQRYMNEHRPGNPGS